jgi:hypothetical protein
MNKKNFLELCTRIKNCIILFLFEEPRRYSQVVRPGIANPLPPVQIWVPPKSKQKQIMGVWWNGRHNRLKIC